MYQLLSKSAHNIARGMAYAGGFILIAVIIMTCISIIGRGLVPVGLSPIHGDFEWVEFGVGLSIFAFLPLCHLEKSHAVVDLFESAYSPLMNRILGLLSDVLMLVISIIIAWRLWLGMMDMKGYGETTFILQFEVWPFYAACFAGAVAFALISIFCVIRTISEFRAASNNNISGKTVQENN